MTVTGRTKALFDVLVLEGCLIGYQRNSELNRDQPWPWRAGTLARVDLLFRAA
jgi:hypothetical protein